MGALLGGAAGPSGLTFYEFHGGQRGPGDEGLGGSVALHLAQWVWVMIVVKGHSVVGSRGSSNKSKQAAADAAAATATLIAR